VSGSSEAAGAATPPVSASYVQREVMSAVMQSREQREAYIHAAMVSMVVALTAEMLDAAAVRPGPLAERLDRARRSQFAGENAAPGRDLLKTMIDWLQSLPPDLPSTMPPQWVEPMILASGLAETLARLRGDPWPPPAPEGTITPA
jgi:hypothetical protein